MPAHVRFCNFNLVPNLLGTGALLNQVFSNNPPTPVNMELWPTKNANVIQSCMVTIGTGTPQVLALSPIPGSLGTTCNVILGANAGEEDGKLNTMTISVVTDDGLTTNASIQYYRQHNQGLAPTGWWKLNEGVGAAANDSAATPHNGGINPNFSWINEAPGSTGLTSSLSFNGGYVNIPRTPALDINGDFTLTFWIKYSTLTDNTSWISADEGSGDTRTKWVIGRWNKGAGQQLQLLLNIPGTSIPGGDYPISANWTPAAFPTWYFVSLVRNGNNIAVYVDAQLLATGTYPNSWPVPNAPLQFGIVEGIFPFPGQMSDVRFYNGTALTAAQITNIFTTGNP